MKNEVNLHDKFGIPKQRLHEICVELESRPQDVMGDATSDETEFHFEEVDEWEISQMDFFLGEFLPEECGIGHGYGIRIYRWGVHFFLDITPEQVVRYFYDGDWKAFILDAL
jgi:hypothetical protein